jgi:protoheme IX farnesyltransferase
LKRRSAWSVIWGGFAGGMPILAGRTLGLGYVDWVGIMLTLTILFWIPTHILTFSLRNEIDYARAAIPTFPSRYGRRITQQVIAFSSIFAVLCMAASAYGIGLTWGPSRLLAVLSGGLFCFATYALYKPSSRVQFGLFKYASIYMMSAMLLLVVGGI